MGGGGGKNFITIRLFNLNIKNKFKNIITHQQNDSPASIASSLYELI